MTNLAPVAGYNQDQVCIREILGLCIEAVGCSMQGPLCAEG